MISVVNKRDFKGDGVYVGRPSILGNPFVIGKDGSRDDVIEKYRNWLWGEYKKKGEVYEELVKLCEIARKGDLLLICWCKPESCHGDVIKRCIEWMMSNNPSPPKKSKEVFDMSRIAVIGSRSLPLSWRSRVDSVVASLLARGHSVGSGGALGADLFALRSLVLSGASACSGSVVFLPYQIESSPQSCRPWLASFRRLGGHVVPGSAYRSSARREFISALFNRSRRLVRASRGVVAFISGRSAGSWFTCEYAAGLGLPVVVFPVDGSSDLRSLGSGQWVRLHSWDGAFRWVPSSKEVRHAEI